MLLVLSKVQLTPYFASGDGNVGLPIHDNDIYIYPCDQRAVAARSKKSNCPPRHC